MENYKTETSPIKRLSQINNPQFAFKTDSNELTENALAQYMQFQNQKKQNLNTSLSKANIKFGHQLYANHHAIPQKYGQSINIVKMNGQGQQSYSKNGITMPVLIPNQGAQ